MKSAKGMASRPFLLHFWKQVKNETFPSAWLSAVTSCLLKGLTATKQIVQLHCLCWGEKEYLGSFMCLWTVSMGYSGDPELNLRHMSIINNKISFSLFF